MPLQNASSLGLHHGRNVFELKVSGKPFAAEPAITAVQAQNAKMLPILLSDNITGTLGQGMQRANVARVIADNRIVRSL